LALAFDDGDEQAKAGAAAALVISAATMLCALAAAGRTSPLRFGIDGTPP
jgi:hypothetical protein